MAATTIGLRLTEHWQRVREYKEVRDLALANNITALHATARDPSLRATFETRDGRRLTAANVQEIVSAVRQRFAAEVQLPKDEAAAVPTLSGFATDMRAVSEGGDLTDMSAYAANADKLRYLHRKMGDIPIDSNNPEVIQREVLYDRVHPMGTGLKRRQKSPEMSEFDEQLVPQALVEQLEHSADPLSRASVRSQAIREHCPDIAYMSWSNMAAGGHPTEWRDPYATAA